MLKKSFENFLLLGVDQFAKLLSLFVLSIFLARILGPNEYGYYTYLFAFVSIFLPFASAGLPTLAMKEFSQKQKNPESIFGTLLFLQTITGVVSVLCAVLIMMFLRPQDVGTQVLVSILMFALALQSGEIVVSWFQTKMRLRVIIPIKVSLMMFFLIVKILSLFLFQSVSSLIVVFVIEILLQTLILYCYFFFSKQLTNISVNINYLKYAIRHAFPLVISGLAVMVYAKADYLFLQYYLGSNTVAQYAVALGITEVLAVAPTLIVKTVTPVLLHAGQFEKELFVHHLSTIYRIMSVISVLMIGVTIIIAAPLIPIVYGTQYEVAKSILTLLSLRLFFTNFGIARSIVINNYGLFYFDLFTNVVGAGLNILGNILLIPIWGWQGAVIASLVALLVSTFLLDFCHPLMKKNLSIELKALITPHKIRLSPIK